MKKRILSLLCAAAMLVSVPISASAETDAETFASEGKTIAFPGAEGGGMYASGARGALESGESIEVYHVTTLADSGEGSFRDAVSAGNRIVVFDVSGYIDLASNVNISHDNMTILGQTAPGDGICFRGNNIKVGGNNIILRYLRFRVGSKLADGSDTKAQDGLEVPDNGNNIIIDHCSVSWGTDENLAAYAVKDLTVQYSIISEALNQSVHDKGEHGYAAIWGGVNMSVHHNLIASHKSRNPKIGTSETVAMTEGYTDDQTLVDMKNNVFYNWGDKAGYGTENGAKTYIQNNIYRPGPATPASKRARIFELSVGQKYETNMLGSVYAAGNKIDVDPGDPDYADAQKVNENNWQDDLHTGVYVDNKFYDTADKSKMVITEPNEQYKQYEKDYPITLDPTDSVYEDVLNNAGATLPKRDKVDERVINEVRTRTAPNGVKGSVGLLDDPLDGVPDGHEAEYDGRGYPIFSNETRSADYDADKDGIADAWEDAMGLDKSNKNDSLNIGPDGYTWLEIFVEESIAGGKAPANLTISAEDKYYTTDETVALTIGGGNAGDITDVEIYCNDRAAARAEYKDGVWTANVTGLPTGNNIITAKAYMKDGGTSYSPLRTVHVIGAQEAVGWTVEGEASFDGECYTLASGGELSQSKSGDFKLVGRIDETDSVAAGITACLGDGKDGVMLFKGRDENNDAAIGYVISSDSNPASNSLIWTPENGSPEDYDLFEIAREGSTLKLYAGTSLADLESTLVAQTDIASETLSVGAFKALSSGMSVVSAEPVVASVSKFSMLKLIEETTSPAVEITNIKDNDRIDVANSSVDVKITADGAAVTEVWVYFNDSPIASLDTNITEEETASIPIGFSEPTAGTLSVYAFDENLCRGSASVAVSVSMDSAPWILADIGYAEGQPQTYAQVTDDYTFKIYSAPGGNIGGTSDRFGYMYQEFSGSSRMYYRSRLQTSSSFGVMLRQNLDPDGVEYYFGGDTDASGAVTYKLMKRASKGASLELVEDVTAKTGSSKNLYFIVEKAEDKINIYQTENGATVYKTKTLIASTDASELGGTYLMGFAETGENAGDFADSGWVAVESLLYSESESDETYITGYENGVVTIKQGNDFAGATAIVCGYDSNNVLVDAKHAEVIGNSADVGAVEGDTHKVLLWKDFSSIEPICEPYDETSTVPDVSGEFNGVEWNFDYGLDWQWQMQEKNVLRPSWTQDIGGNKTGIMAIEPTADYSGDRYIFREYIPQDGMTPDMSAEVLLAGDEPVLNIYFQVGDVAKAYKVTFSDDGKIYSNGDVEAGEWDAADGWYNVAISTDVDETGASAAKLTVKKGDTAIVDNAPIEMSGADNFRSQKNVEKKYDVANAVYFEPLSSASGKYYIDNVKINQHKGSYTVTREASWYSFNKISAISGAFTVDGTTELNGEALSGTQLSVASGAELKTGGKSLGTLSFTNRIRINGSKGKITLPVENGSVVTVYAASASSSEPRALIINGQSTNVQALCATAYTYTGADGTIEISSGSNIEISAISVEKITVVQNN